MHVHMTGIDTVILDDESPREALQHVPAGRNALVALGFTKENNCRVKMSGERILLTEKTILQQNIIAAYNADGNLIQNNMRFMKKRLNPEDVKQCESIKEFAQSEKSTATKKRRRSTDQDDDDQHHMESDRCGVHQPGEFERN